MVDRKIRAINGPRGTFLLAVSSLTLIHAISCLPFVTDRIVLPFGLDLLNDVVPLPVYAGFWIVAAAICILGAIRHSNGTVRETTDSLAFGLSSGMLLLWGLTYLAGWVVEDSPNEEWVFGVVYLSVGWVVSTAARLDNVWPSSKVVS